MTGITDIESRVLSSLDATGVPYELLECEPAYADTAAFCQRYGYPLWNAGNTILVASKKEPRSYGACVVAATGRLDVNKAVRNLMGGARLSFARPDDTVRVTGMLIGGVTIFALPSELPLFVDQALMDLEYVILGSGSRSSKIKIDPEVFSRLDAARIVPELSIPSPA